MFVNFWTKESPIDSGRWKLIREEFEGAEKVEERVVERDLSAQDANAAAIALNRMAIKCGDHIAVAVLEATDEVRAA